MPESVQSCFELSMHLSVFFFPRTILSSSSRLVCYIPLQRGKGGGGGGGGVGGNVHIDACL